MQHRRRRSFRRDSGFALVVALLLLVAMSFIGIAALKNVTLQEKMTGNTYFKLASFQEADGAMRSVEQIMHGIFGSSTQTPPAQATNNVWKTADPYGAGAAYWGTTSAWTQSQSVTPLGYSGAVITITSDDVVGGDIAPYACSDPALSGIGTNGAEQNLPCKVRPVRETAISTDTATGARSVIQQYFNYRPE